MLFVGLDSLFAFCLLCLFGKNLCRSPTLRFHVLVTPCTPFALKNRVLLLGKQSIPQRTVGGRVVGVGEYSSMRRAYLVYRCIGRLWHS